MMKNRRVYILVALLALLSMVLTACKPLTADDILTKTVTAMKNTTTMAVALDMAMTGMGMSMNITGTGVAQQPDQGYFKMEVMGTSAEVLMLSKEELYTRSDGTDWTAVSEADFAQYGLNFDSIMNQNFDVSLYKDLEKVENETVDGVDCYHLTFSVDPSQFQSTIDQLTSSGVAVTLTSTSGDVWVGVKDFLIRKMVTGVVMNVQDNEFSIITTVNYSNYGEPVEIPTVN